MKPLKLKVCGMRDPENIQGLIDIGPDFMGFIFYEKSARFVDSLDPNVLAQIPQSIKKVGVFVNESIDRIEDVVQRYGLDLVQLHGDEDVAFVEELKGNGISVIKVFRVADSLPSDLHAYEDLVDYLLFDTDTKNYGGSGKQFNWNMLKEKEPQVPFLLSGGLRLQDLQEIRSLEIATLHGIDVNSKFEIEAGLKDLELIKKLKMQL